MRLERSVPRREIAQRGIPRSRRVQNAINAWVLIKVESNRTKRSRFSARHDETAVAVYETDGMNMINCWRRNRNDVKKCWAKAGFRA